MALKAGTQLGAFKITGQLGVGGMGEVYRATDTKLGREIALKTLPASLADDPDRLARFEREAKLLASLNHAHIASVHSLDEHEGTLYIAMELIEGETLENKLKRGALPVEDALQLGLQIALALEAAHEKGVVHRDLKPANIMITPDGVVKVLDFGLAKGFSGNPNEASPLHSPALSAAMTQAGLVLGTAGYMSPEQASGQATDQRADIWGFGVLLYEMLTGLPVFSGESVPHILADVLKTEPNWSNLPRDLHPRLKLLLERCLEKKVRNRYHSIADARVDIESVLSNPRVTSVTAHVTAPFWRRALSPAAAAVVAGLGVWLAIQAFETPDQPVAEIVRFRVPLGEGVRDDFDEDTLFPLGATADGGRPSRKSLTWSNAGDLLVYSAYSATVSDQGFAREGSRLYLRRLDQARAEPIAGTEGGINPFFSPDDAWLGFFDGSSLRRVSLETGSVETLATAIDVLPIGPMGATWGDDGTIVFAGWGGLFRVDADGGEPVLIVARDVSDFVGERYVQPELLPGSNVLLLHAHTADPGRAEVRALDLRTGTQTTLLRDAMDPHYVQETGQLVFARRGSLMAVGFDPGTLAVVGTPVVIVDDVMQAVGMPNGPQETGAAQYAFSSSGDLAYAAGGVFPPTPLVIVRVSADGEVDPLISNPLSYAGPRVSPDRDRLLFWEAEGRGGSIYVHDLGRGVTQRLNTGGFANLFPVWSPDGTSIAFASDRAEGISNLYRMAADGSGEPERLAPSERQQAALSWSSEGVIAYVLVTAQGNRDIWLLPPDGEPTPFVVSDAQEQWPSFSPDGRWLAYGSDESGRNEVYVRPYPGPGSATLVSGNGGAEPAWSNDGSQLFYTADVNAPEGGTRSVLMIVDVMPGEPFLVSRARTLIDPWPYPRLTPARGYDVLPDGGFVAVANPVRDAAEIANLARRYLAQEIHVVIDFVEELRRRAGN